MNIENSTAQGEILNVNSKPKGILALITGPIPYFPYDDSIASTATSKVRKYKKTLTAETSSSFSIEQRLNVMKTEFTLIYFCAAWCKNSLCFNPTLVKFVQRHKNKCQCLVVSNDANDESSDRLCHGMGFMRFPLDHPNRSALYRYVCVRSVDFNCVP